MPRAHLGISLADVTPQESNQQLAMLLRSTSSAAVIDALAEYCEGCALKVESELQGKTFKSVRKEKVTSFLEAAAALRTAQEAINVAEAPVASGDVLCVLADAAEATAED